MTAILLIMLSMLSLAGCGKAVTEETPQAYFIAEVLEVHGTNMLVAVIDKGNSGATAGSEAYVTKNVTSEEGCPNLYVGDIIKVYFDGSVMESYPLQLGEVFSIKKIQSAPTPDWGVKLTAENVTAKGLTIVCEQSGGNPSGDLMTGSYYVIENFDGKEWSKVSYKYNGEAEIAWDDIGYIISKDGTTKWDVDWKWLYGELTPGQYRIGKEIMDFRTTGDYDKVMFYANFYVIEYILEPEEAGVFSFREDLEQSKNYEPLVRRDGFNNTSPVEIKDMYDAIERAKADQTVYYNRVSVSYDSDECVWRVSFWQTDTLGGSERIYLDSSGITIMSTLGE